MARRVLADFRDGNGFVDISAFVKYDTLTVTSRAVSDNWHYAQSVASFTVNYDATLFALIRNATDDIYVSIFDDATQIFTGYVPPTTSYSYNGMLSVTSISLEAVDFGEYLIVEVGDVCYRGFQIMNPADPAHSIVHQLAYLAGFTVGGIDASITISDTLDAFAPPSASDKIRDLLDALLFEYGYVLHFNGSGQISPLVWRYTTASPILEFNDSNMVRELTVQDELRAFDGAEVIYYELAEAVTTSGQTDILLYRDAKLPYDSNGAFLGYVVLSGYTYPPETNVIDPATGQDTVVYQKYEDNAVKYWTNEAIKNQLDYNYKAFTSDFSTIVATSGHYLDYNADANVQLVLAEFGNTQARIVYSGLNSTANKLYYSNVYGKVLYKTAERSSKVENIASPKKMDRYVSSFIYTKPYADALVQALAMQYATDNIALGITYGSRLAVGQLVTISGGDGTVGLGYITEWKYSEKEQLYSYRVRTYSVTSGILSPQLVSVPSAANTPTLNITYITKGEAVPIITEIVESMDIAAPAYLGRYEAAHPTSYAAGDWWTVYDTDDSPIQRGVWYSNAGTPTRISSSSPVSVQAKWPNALTDVAWAEANNYGVAMDYGIENFYETLAVVQAFVQSLATNRIQLTAGGSIFGGGYDENGYNSLNLPGFYLNDLGVLLAKEVTFESVNARNLRTYVDYFATWQDTGTVTSGGFIGTSYWNIRPGLVRVASNEALLYYGKQSDTTLYTRRYTNGVFGDEIIASGRMSASQNTSMCALDTGSVFMATSATVDSVNNRIMEAIMVSGGTWTTLLPVLPGYYSNFFATEYLPSSDEVLVAFQNNTISASDPNYNRWYITTRSPSGVYSTPEFLTASGADELALKRLADNRVYALIGATVSGITTYTSRIRDTAGVWGTESIESSFPTISGAVGTYASGENISLLPNGNLVYTAIGSSGAEASDLMASYYSVVSGTWSPFITLVNVDAVQKYSVIAGLSSVVMQDGSLLYVTVGNSSFLGTLNKLVPFYGDSSYVGLDKAGRTYSPVGAGITEVTASGLAFGSITSATPTAISGTLIYRDGAGRAQIATPELDADIANKGYVDQGSPIGVVVMYAGSTAPSGWLICNGSAISRSTYAALFLAIGTIWGVGNGSTTFNLPDFRESAPVGVGTYSAVTGTTHDAIAVHDAFTLSEFKDDQLQQHGHVLKSNVSGSNTGTYNNLGNAGGNNAGQTATENEAVLTVKASSGMAAVRVSTTTRGKRLGINFIIKYI